MCVCVCLLECKYVLWIHCFVGRDRYLRDTAYSDGRLWRSSGLFYCRPL